MAVVPRKRKGRVVYGVLTSWGKDKPPHWELVGPNKREAQDLDRRRRKEVKAGTFKPGQVTGEASVATYAAGWLAKRNNRAAAADRSTMRDHALSAKWFAEMPMTDVRPKHIIQLIEEIQARGTMAPKSLTNLMGVIRVMFRDATIAEVIAASPYVVPKGKLSRRGKKRVPYSVDELEALVSDAVGERQQMWNLLAFYLGARMGEICGLCWGDWDRMPDPLGSMRIERQYEGRETKTGRLRVVPVHPRLAEALKAWHARWFLHYLRRPGPKDFIVPVRADESMTRTVAYKAWRKGCLAAEVTNKTVHSTRHTFITLTQRGGADRRIVELITHNPKEEIIDTYTTRAWSELCEAVLCMPSARASKTPSPAGSPGEKDGFEASVDSSGFQNVRGFSEVSRVRVLELEPQESKVLSPRQRAQAFCVRGAQISDVAGRDGPGAAIVAKLREMDRNAYALDMTWPAILQGLGLRPANILRRAELPGDLFARPSASLDSASYFRFWSALEAEAGDGLLPLRLYQALRAESFSPALFAALCSPNLATALDRLSKYKTLVAPMRLEIQQSEDSVTLGITWLDSTLSPPVSLVAAELLFFVCLARMGTHERIAPRSILTECVPTPTKPYEDFVGCPIRRGKGHTVVFAKGDATRPFLSSNEGMWSIFEPALRKRLADLEASASTAARVRAALLEGLPSGGIAVEVVAQRLALSKRTLQRRLDDEGTSFQAVLRETREALAVHYLERTRLPVAEISFLLGFEEPNSFFRAFNEWTGRTPETVRRNLHPT